MSIRRGVLERCCCGRRKVNVSAFHHDQCHDTQISVVVITKRKQDLGQFSLGCHVMPHRKIHTTICSFLSVHKRLAREQCKSNTRLEIELRQMLTRLYCHSRLKTTESGLNSPSVQAELGDTRCLCNHPESCRSHSSAGYRQVTGRSWAAW